MLIDHAAERALRAKLDRRALRSPLSPLLAAVSELAEGQAQMLRHRERAWASVTFSGARHTLVLAFTGATAIEAGERLIAALPEHEFAIRGQLVADAVVLSADHTLLPQPGLTVTCELLLLEES